MTDKSQEYGKAVEYAQLESLSTLTRSISRALNLEVVFLAFPTSKPGEPVTDVQAVAVASHGMLAPSFEYDLTETPCRLIYEGQETFIPCDVALQFPMECGWNGYIGVPIHSADGGIIGHIAAMTSAPIEHRGNVLDVFRRYAHIAATLVGRFTREGIVGAKLAQLPSTLRGLVDAPQLDVHSGLPVRSYLEARGKIAFAHARQLQKNINVLYFVLDNSDAHNTRFPGVVGDAIARALGDVLRAHVGPNKGVCARLGSREFAVLLPLTAPAAAEDLMLAISNSIQQACVEELRLSMPIVCGIGRSSISKIDRDFGMILRRAQMAIFAAADIDEDGARADAARAVLAAKSNVDLTSDLRVVFYY
ncbi:MAG: diguanylate cyclase [Hyphomicrobium sp.]